MPLESPHYYNPAFGSYTMVIEAVIIIAGILMIRYGGRVLRGVVLLLIGAVIIPLSGMQEWELSVRSDLTQPIPLAGIIPIALAAGIAYVVSAVAEQVIRILVALTFWSCKALFGRQYTTKLPYQNLRLRGSGAVNSRRAKLCKWEE